MNDKDIELEAIIDKEIADKLQKIKILCAEINVLTEAKKRKKFNSQKEKTLL
jgi:hypothetical protein